MHRTATILRTGTGKTLKRVIPQDLRVMGGLIVIMWVLIAVVWAMSADAYVLHNCRYEGTSPAIGYQYHSMEYDNKVAVSDAERAWDATSAPGYFWYDSGGDPELDIYDAYYSGSAWAFIDYGEHGCSSSPGTWDYNETDLQIDIGDTSGATATELKIAMIHELGHTYGLDHTSLTCIFGPAVMRDSLDIFNCSGTAPWSNDVAGVHAAY